MRTIEKTFSYEDELEECDHRISLLHYRDDYKQFQEVCRQKAAYSVKRHTALSIPKSTLKDEHYDDTLAVPRSLPQSVSFKGIFK